jgi:hypothetical protein
VDVFDPAPARGGGRRFVSPPRPPADYDDASSQPLFSVTVHDHPEFILDYDPTPQAGSGVWLNRPERMLLQCWFREVRGDGFVLKASMHPALALGVNQQCAACMVPEQSGAVWHYSEHQHGLRTATAPETRLLLAVKDDTLTLWAQVIATPNQGPEERWQFWREQ